MSTPEHTPPNGLQTYQRLLRYMLPHWLAFAASILGFMIYAGTQTAFAKWMEFVVDTLESGQLDMRWLIALLVVVIFIIRGIGSFLGTYCISYVARHIVLKLRTDLFHHMIQLPNSYFQNHSTGELISKLTYNVERVTSAATEAIKTAVREGLTVVGLLGYLFYLNWKLSLLLLAVTPLIAIVVKLASKRFRTLSHRIQDVMGDVTSAAQESIKGYQEIKAFGAHASEDARFSAACRNDRHQQMKMVVAGAVNTPVVQLLVAVALASLMYVAMHPTMMASMSTGEFIAFVTAAGMLSKPLRALTNVNTMIQQGIAASESIFAVIDLPPETDTGSQVVTRVAGELRFENVDFTYPEGDKPVLRGIDFHIPAGQSLALVGHSGSGKSTLTQLIPRFLDPSSGAILLDGVPLADYRLSNLREQVALVNQQVILFNGTIADNIAFGCLASKSRADITAAAAAAHVLEFTDKLPLGLDTPVGENGLKLSGGQRQRLALARAILKNAPILILDEATSALDTESERLIQQSLEQIMQDRTSLVIAHRLSTIERADRILVMDSGRIIESGSHKTLLEQDGAYARLYRAQFQDGAAPGGAGCP